MIKRLLLLLLFPVVALAQGVIVNPKTVLGTTSGVTRPIPAATITVCAAGAVGVPCAPPLASVLFKDAALTQPLSNPFSADANGNYQFAIAGGTYTITESASGFSGYSYQLTVSCAPGICSVSSLTVSGNATINGTLTATNFSPSSLTVTGALNANGTTTVKNLDNIVFVDGVNFTTINAACAANPGGMVYVPSGTLVPTATISCANPVNIVGAGQQQTIIKPGSGSCVTIGNYLFLLSSPSSGQGNRIADLTIDLSNCPGVGAADLSNLAKPYIERVRVVYSDGSPGTGTTFNMSNTDEPHMINVRMRSPGNAIVVGETVGEIFLDSITIECPLVGFKVNRTTATDFGGIYMTSFKVTNPCNRTPSQGSVLSSTATNTLFPMFMVDTTFDNSLGGPTFSDTNINKIRSVDSWVTNGDTLGNQRPAFFLSGVTEFTSTGDVMQSAWCDFEVAGANSQIHIESGKFYGGNVNLCQSVATLTNSRIVESTFNSSPVASAADMSLWANAAPPPAAATGGPFSTGGGHFWVSGSQGTGQELGICNKDVGATNSCKWFSTNSSGDFQINNNANSGQVIRITDAGTIIPTGPIALAGTSSLNASGIIISPTSPTIAAGGCGGSAAAIQNANSTASFEIFTGTAPTSAGCTVTFPAAAHHWICPTITHTSAVSTTNFIILQTGALSSTSVTFQLFSDVAAATAPAASDTWAVSGCHAN